MENIAFETLLALIDDLTDEQRATFIKVLDITVRLKKGLTPESDN